MIDPLSAQPNEVAEYFIATATKPSKGLGRPLSLSTLALYRTAINCRFGKAQKDSPAKSTIVDETFKGLSRLLGTQSRRVKALREGEIAAMISNCSSTCYGKRDAALISIGFAAALRRSELCALRREDLEFISSNKLMIHIRRSKTDQTGIGQKIAIPNGKLIKPLTRLRSWLSVGSTTEGYVFQTMQRSGLLTGRSISDTDVSRVVKRYVRKIGLNPKEYSAHSLRAGFVTSAAVHHARLDKIMEITRHKSPVTVMKYIRDANFFTDHAGADFL